MYSIADILTQVDECNEHGHFPMLDNGHFYLAGTRLSGYRDEECWSLVIETLVYGPRSYGHSCICVFRDYYGNCLKIEPGTSPDPQIHPTKDGPEGPTFTPPTDPHGQHVSPTAQTIQIRNQVVQIPQSTTQYMQEGIELEDPPRVQGWELLRWLAPRYRPVLLATEDELHACLVKHLPLILLLDEWHHPDVLNGEKPSDTETFRMIADVLTTGDPSKYHPTELLNTHWSNWPLGGTL